MLKKIVTYSLLALAILVFGAYFYAASRLSAAGRNKELCDGISVTVLDSTLNRFVSKSEVVSIISKADVNPSGKTRGETDLHGIEVLLRNRSAIKDAQASISKDGTLKVEITQRRPLLRIQTRYGGFYIDDSEYIFPLVPTFTSYVPVVTGHIPIRLQEGYRGNAGEDSKDWIRSVIRLAEYLDRHPLWNSQIQQIHVEKNLDVIFYTVVGDQKIVFGKLDDLDYKFAKLKTFYDEIVPLYGWERYSEINLKFSDQIICTLRDRKNKSKNLRI